LGEGIYIIPPPPQKGLLAGPPLRGSLKKNFFGGFFFPVSPLLFFRFIKRGGFFLGKFPWVKFKRYKPPAVVIPSKGGGKAPFSPGIPDF